MRAFWLHNGTGSDSYADNQAATAAWLDILSSVSSWSSQELSQDYRWLVSFIKNVLLEPDRQLRPTAAQIFNRLHDMCQIRAPLEAQLLVGNCCTQTIRSNESGTSRQRLHWPLLDLWGIHSDLGLIVLDINLKPLASSARPDLQADIESSLSDQNNLDTLESVARYLVSLAGVTATKRSMMLSETPLYLYKKSLYLACRNDTEVQVTQLRLRDHCQSSTEERPPHTYQVQIMLTTVQLQRHAAYSAPFIALVFDPKSGVACNSPADGKSDVAFVSSNNTADLAHVSSVRSERQLLPCRIFGCDVVSTCASQAK